MISMIFRKRRHRLKESILRGVFEENLKILGKPPFRISERMPLSAKKISLSFLVILLFILGHGNSLNLPLFQEKQTIASSAKINFSPPPENLLSLTDNSANLSDAKAFLKFPGVPLSRTFGLTVKTVMIDPGHGGSQNGTIGKMGTREKDITLDIAKRLKMRLDKYRQYNVIMTREDDVTLPLNKRVALAKSYKADLFVSIHINYLPSRPTNIIETYYFGSPSDDTTLKLAELENADSQYRMSDFRKIIEKIGNTLKYQESKKLAASIQKSLFLNISKEDGNVQNKGIKTAPFFVLLGVDVPAVLAEVSCLSNSKEERELNNETHRENIAHYLETGILDYLNKGEASYEAKRR